MLERNPPSDDEEDDDDELDESPITLERKPPSLDDW
jgi:hypothetical protein